MNRARNKKRNRGPNFFICNQGDERRRSVGPHLPRIRQVRRGPHGDSHEAELPPQLRPLAPQQTRLHLSRHQDATEGGGVGTVLLVVAVWQDKEVQNDQEIQEELAIIYEIFSFNIQTGAAG